MTDFPTVTVDRLKERAADGSLDLIDVRTPVEFREVHAVGARNVPLDSLDPQTVMRGRNGTADEPLYVCCRGGTRRAKACEKFVAAGFTNVVNVEGGVRWPGSRPGCRWSVERRRCRWSGKSGLPPGHSSCSGRRWASSSIPTSWRCRPSSVPGWSSPA